MIIPTNSRKTGFYKNLFWKHKDQLWGAIEPEEFDIIVEKASKEFQYAYSIMRNKEVEEVSMWYKVFLTLATLLIFSFFAFTYFGIKDENDGLISAGLAFLFIGGVMAVGVGLSNFLHPAEDNFTLEEHV